MLERSMEFYQQMKSRRTVREFSAKNVPREIIENCLRTAGTSVSGANLQPWHFAVVSDPAIKKKIRVAAEKEEKLLAEKSVEYSKSLDPHLFTAYNRIRSKVKNGLAVVAIERGASGGSYFTIPPQVQLEIANRKRITIDEHSGRILVDAALAEEEKQKIDKIFS